MSKKLNYPLLGLLIQVPLLLLLALLHILGLLDWGWQFVLGVPVALAAGCVVAGLLEHVLASKPAPERARVRSRPIL